VRAYWTEQWTRTRPHDEPLSFSELDDGRAALYIRQFERSLDGSLISRGHFLHMHRIEGDLISQDIICERFLRQLLSLGLPGWGSRV
jgi:hypothetical protein